VGEDAGEHRRVRRELLIGGIGERAVRVRLAGLTRIELHDAFRLGVGSPGKAKRVDEPEHCRVEADAQRQYDHGRDREAGRFRQVAQRNK
jgi:hypothetical protein